eukprot:1125539-Amphidinium_carterae.1
MESVDGRVSGQSTVMVLTVSGSFVSDRLLEGSPRESRVHFFSSASPGHGPSLSMLLDQVTWPAEFVEGVTANLADQSGTLTLYITRRGAEEPYASATELDPRVDPRQLVGLGLFSSAAPLPGGSRA